MKKIGLAFLAFFCFGTIITSCKPDINLFAEYKDITIVYSILDSDNDTNFVKINKVFMDPDMQILPNDSINYPGKLDARIVEYKANIHSSHYTQTRELILDTITIHNKVPGSFEYPDQLVYYTTEKIHGNDEYSDYKYELQIHKNDTVITAETYIVGGSRFIIVNGVVNFDHAVTASPRCVEFYECPNGAMYELVFRFDFSEITTSNDTIRRNVSWSLGTFTKNDLELTMNQNKYRIPYNSSDFFYKISKAIDTTDNIIVERLFFKDPITITVASCGIELYNFITINGPSTSISQTIPDYTNVNGGYGVFSSRTMVSKAVKLGGQTIPELEKRENWRFRQAE